MIYKKESETTTLFAINSSVTSDINLSRIIPISFYVGSSIFFGVNNLKGKKSGSDTKL